MDDNLLTTDTAALDEVPLERLETEIAGFASRLAAATARWLLWIAAYDRREGWASWEAKSCVHWLNWQCGVSPRTAREHVRVAHTLVEFDQLRDMFVAGQLSYSKVRAISRVITVDNEVDILHIARNGTASQLERILGKLPPARLPRRTKHRRVHLHQQRRRHDDDDPHPSGRRDEPRQGVDQQVG